MTETPHRTITRKHFLGLAGATALLGMAGFPALAATGKMGTKQIPKSGEQLPMIGFGTSRTFDVGNDAARLDQLTEVMRVLYGAGGTILDTSPMYGSAQDVIGELLTRLGSRDRTFIATKVWIDGRERGMSQMRESMARMRTDKIELMAVHNLVDWRTQLATLREWKEKGILKYIGITHWTASALEPLAEIVASEELDFVQFAYAISTRDAEARLLPLCAERGVATMINRPFVRGSLFRRARGKKLPGWAADYGIESWAQYFLKFIVSHPAVTCTIPGTDKPEYARDNVAAGMGPMPNAAARRRMIEYWEDL